MDLSKGECAIARLQRLLTMATASSAHLRVSFIRSRGDCLHDFMTLERPLNGDAFPKVNVTDVERRSELRRCMRIQTVLSRLLLRLTLTSDSWIVTI